MARPQGSSSLCGSGWGRRGAIALGVVAAVVIGAAACGGSSSPAPAASSAAPAASSPAAAGLHLPGQLFGLSKNTSPGAEQVTRAISSQFSALSSIARSHQAALYGTEGGPALLVIAARLSSAAAHRAASAAFDKRAAAGGTAGAGSTDARPFPAGPHGGALKCGHAARGGQRALLCVWADKWTFGGVIYALGSASSLSDAASKTNQVRSAVGT
jgi:hypothetical protein